MAAQGTGISSQAHPLSCDRCGCVQRPSGAVYQVVERTSFKVVRQLLPPEGLAQAVADCAYECVKDIVENAEGELDYYEIVISLFQIFSTCKAANQGVGGSADQMRRQ